LPDNNHIPGSGEVAEPSKPENTEPIKADPPVPRQPVPVNAEAPAVEGAPKTAAPPTAEKTPTPGQNDLKGKDNPTPGKEDKSQPGKTEQQVTIPGMGDPTPAEKVVDFTAARDGTVKDKPMEKAAGPDKGKQPGAPMPRRGSPPKKSKSAPVKPPFGTRSPKAMGLGSRLWPKRRIPVLRAAARPLPL
jgi:hypothetical protein